MTGMKWHKGRDKNWGWVGTEADGRKTTRSDTEGAGGKKNNDLIKMSEGGGRIVPKKGIGGEEERAIAKSRKGFKETCGQTDKDIKKKSTKRQRMRVTLVMKT